MKSSIKNILGISILALVAWMNSGCDFLTTEPHTLVPETYFNTEEEIESFLTGVYAPIAEEHFYGGNYQLYLTNGDDLTFYQRSTPPNGGSITTVDANSGNQYVGYLWKVLYQGINRANMLLENADNNPDVPKAVRDCAKAEARCLRAFYYFNLVQGWGDVPFKLTSTQTVKGNDLPRTDKQIIYDTIINDLVNSIPDLPTIGAVETPETLSQTAVKGMLARIWLFRAGECYRDNQSPDETFRKHCFEEAARWAKDVKENDGCGLVKPYKQVFLDYCQDEYNSTNVIESIWEVPFTGNFTTAEKCTGRIGNTIGLGSTSNLVGITTHTGEGGLANPGYSYAFTYASLKLYDYYDANGDTERGNWNIAPFEYTYSSDKKDITGKKWYYGKRDTTDKEPAGYKYTDDSQQASDNNKTRCCAKYRREYEKVLPKHKNYTPINYPLIRYSDVLLMLAEATNELGTDQALVEECVNAVRQRADIDPLPSGLSKDEMREKIKEERAMELCFESIRRWDLIRWGDFVKNMQEMIGYVNRTGWGGNYTYAENYYNVSSTYCYFPIPDSEMSINKAITSNNPGW
ncbi:MAG: RagB/SusD family nutrient uptake outer membrane protein [Paludibacteraceae bacterium]